MKAKALVLALKGPTQRWYTNFPEGHIHSWSQLRTKLLTSFWSMKPDEVTSCNFHDIKQGEKETLQLMYRWIDNPWFPSVVIEDG